MGMLRHQSPTSKEQGVAAVELAMVLPLFCIFLLGIFEIGGIARDHQVLQNAAREGARFASLSTNRIEGLDPADVAAVQTTIKNRVISYLSSEKITVTAGDISLDQAYPITVGGLTIRGSKVVITYTRPLLFSGITKWVTPGTSVKGQAIFRNLY